MSFRRVTNSKLSLSLDVCTRATSFINLCVIRCSPSLSPLICNRVPFDRSLAVCQQSSETCRNLSSAFFCSSRVIHRYGLDGYVTPCRLDLLCQLDASVRICNQGGYLAKCYLQSQSMTYGRQMRRTDTGLFAVGQCETLDVPINAIRNRLECKALAFIAVYKSIFSQEFASPTYEYCYKITGTTLSPAWSQTRC